ncbi:hypothetical protein TNIN_93421 [Trichonephila inaurata madagascariensis]|uniref:Uncharacterized protein n=1 Tax=Trichonephila inaurata madagascariensis TaxID=2747483 RepID=A0A8X6XPR1_9ARAC|nr:hypothetical protein TNIN_93421 [Trichonephila inaurata madagascariensis]
MSALLMLQKIEINIKYNLKPHHLLKNAQGHQHVIEICMQPWVKVCAHPQLQDEQKFENALIALTACSERKDDTVYAKEASSNETVEVSFKRYEETPPNYTVKLCAVCSKKIVKTAYFAVNASSLHMSYVQKSVTQKIKLNRKPVSCL